MARLDIMSLASTSGDRYLLSAGPYAAEVVQCGATLRTLTHGGRPLILPFGLDEVRPDMRGAVMLPWPGRIEDGRYTFAGVDHQLPLTEPRTSNAIHGLIGWAPFTVVEQDESSVALRYLMLAQAGYEFALQVDIGYRLDATSGLTVKIGATNLGTGTAPYGAANHVYFVAGKGKVDDWTLEFDAQSYLTSPGPRSLPDGPYPVAGSDLDFGSARPIGPVRLNHSYTGGGRDADGWGTATVLAADGHGVRVRWDPAVPWIHPFSYDLPGAASRTGLALEPMTCPPNSFNSGTDLIALAPGDSHTFTMAIDAL
jgi:aldose 1-epimerase